MHAPYSVTAWLDACRRYLSNLFVLASLRVCWRRYVCAGVATCVPALTVDAVDLSFYSQVSEDEFSIMMSSVARAMTRLQLLDGVQDAEIDAVCGEAFLDEDGCSRLSIGAEDIVELAERHPVRCAHCGKNVVRFTYWLSHTPSHDSTRVPMLYQLLC